MEKLNKNSRLTVIGILLFQIGIFIAAAFITTPYYQTDDDNTMAAISLGMYGKRDYHLVYMHTILGKLLNGIASVSSIVNWYTLFQYALLFCAFAVILMVLVKGSGLIRSITVLALVGMVFNFNFHHALLFTQTAGAVTLAGVLLLVDIIEQGQKKKGLFFAGAAFLLLGSMYRFEGYGMILCTSFLWVLVRFVRHIRKKAWLQVKQYIIWFGVPIVLSVLLYIGDLAVYQMDEGWKAYREYNDLRSELLDFGFPEMEDNKELYEALEIKEIDYENFTLWDFADVEKLTAEDMKQLTDAKGERLLINTLRSFLAEGYLKVIKFSFLWLIPLGIGYFLCYKRKDWLELAAIIAGAIGMEVFFIYVGRAQLQYTTALIVLTMLSFLCYSSKGKAFFLSKKWAAAIGCAVCCIVSVAALYKNFMWEIELKYLQNQNPDRDEVTALIYEDTSNFYISKVGHGVQTFTDIWKPVQEGEAKNATTLGDWLTMSPIVLNQWQEYGVTNPYRALAELENTYLLDCCTSAWKLDYIVANYNADAKMTLVKNIGGYEIYQFSDKELELDIDTCQNAENLVYDVYLEETERRKLLSGCIYEVDTNSFDQRMYLGVTKEGQDEAFYEMTQVRNYNSDDVYNGKYAGFSFEYAGVVDFEKDTVALYLENEKGLYRIEYND